MRAARVRRFDRPIAVETVPDPVLRPGCAIIRVEAAYVPSPMKEFTEGRVPFALPPLPYTPGADAIGTVERVADDVHGIAPGQRVYCDDWVTLRGGAPRIGAYVGLAAPMPGAQPVLAEWPDGCFAEKILLPAECLTALGAAERVPPEILVRLGYIGTGYGALRRGEFRAGQVVVVNGATGALGVSTAMLALAMGAARVVALGRKPAVLEKLRALDPRVATVSTADGIDPAKIVAAGGGPADVFIDAIGFTRDSGPTLAGIGALGLEGFAVLIGGLDAPVPVAYATQMIELKLTIRGSEWFPYAAAGELLRLIGVGVLDLGPLRAKCFPLDRVSDALDRAAEAADGFCHVAIMPAE